MNVRLVLLLLVLLAAGGVAYLKWQQAAIPPDQAQATGTFATGPPAREPATPESLSRETEPGPVVDQNGDLGAFAGHLDRVAQTWITDLGIELGIVSADLRDDPIEATAASLFSERAVGGETPNGGLLIVFDGRSHQARIEVSYALESIFPDSFVGRVAETQLAPYAGNRMAGMAAMDTARFLKDFAFIQAAAGRLSLPEGAEDSQPYREKLAYLSGGAGATTDLGAIADGLLRVTGHSSDQVETYLPGTQPQASVDAVLRVWSDQVPNPNLDLFTPGTRMQRAAYPYAPFEIAERLDRFRRSGEPRILVEGDRAVVMASEPVTGFVPILLHYSDGHWRVDDVELWKNLFYDESGNYYLRNSNTPYAFGLQHFGEGNDAPIDAVAVDDDALLALAGSLQVRDDALAHFELGELLFRNAFAAVAALREYEKAVALAPVDPLFRSVLADRYLYLGLNEMAYPHLEQLGRAGRVRLTQAYALSGDYEATEKTALSILEDNPFSYHALAWLDYSLQARGIDDPEVQRQLAELLEDSQARYRYVRLGFGPQTPLFDNLTSVNVQGTTVFGHSIWSVSMTNFSARPVRIEKVILRSLGTTRPSGLGDIRSYWTFANPELVLDSGESVVFDKTWGFTEKTRDQRMSYEFTICWRGVEDDASQCEAQLLHLASSWSSLPSEGAES